MVSKTPYPVEPGETIRTTSRANAVLTFEDGSRVELAGNSSFTLEETASSSYSMGLGFGRLKAFVEKIAARRPRVRTPPSAVSAVRGTEFQVEVLGDGTTNVDLYKGLLAVDDNHGRQILLHPNETTRINMMGLGASKRTPTRREIQRARFRDMVHGEIAHDMRRQRSIRGRPGNPGLADYQRGKTVINAFGQTVRVEGTSSARRPTSSISWCSTAARGRGSTISLTSGLSIRRFRPT